MRPLFIISILLLCFALPGRATDSGKVDSLENAFQKYDKVKYDSVQNVILQELYDIYFSNDIDKALNCCKRAIEIGNRSDNYKILYDWYIKYGSTYRKLGLNSLALENYEKAMQIGLENDYQTGWAYISTGNFYYSNDNYKKAEKLYKRAIENFDKLKTKDRIEYLTGKSVALNNIGMVFEKNNKLKKAIQYYHKAFNLRKKLGYTNELSHSCMLIGEYYQALNNSDSVYFYYNKGIEFGNKDKTKDFLVKILINKAEYLAGEHKYSSAIENCKKAIKITRQKQLLRLKPRIYSVYAQVYQKAGELDSAFRYAYKGYNFSKETKNFNYQISLLRLLADISTKKNDYDIAIDFLNKSINLSETLKTEERRKLQFTFENIYNRKEINSLKYELSLLDKENSTKLFVIILSVLLLFGALTFSFILYRKQKQVKKLLLTENVNNSYRYTLTEIIEDSITSNSLESFLQRTLETILNAKWLSINSQGAIFLVNEKGDLEMVAQKDIGQKRIDNCSYVKSGDCVCGQAVARKKTFIGTAPTRLEQIEDKIPFIHMKMPIILGNEALGLLSLYIEKTKGVKEKDIDFFESVSFSLANIIKKEQVLKKLAEQKKNQDVLNQKLFAQNLQVDQQNIEIKRINDQLKEQNDEILKINKELKARKNELQRANATKNKFFSIIAHDLRNPFNVLFGFSNLLLKNHTKYDDQKREQMIKPIVDSAKRTYDLLENLLEWSRAQTDKIEFVPDKHNLKTLVFETLFDIKGNADNKQIEVKSEIEEGVELYADGQMIRTILRNLMSNAVKFTPRKGKVTIFSEKKGNSTYISVKDSGVGMSKEKIKKLFDINEKNTTLGTDDEKGTGLGLILCKEFVVKHNGKMNVESEEGKGTTFTFSIPDKV